MVGEDVELLPMGRFIAETQRHKQTFPPFV